MHGFHQIEHTVDNGYFKYTRMLFGLKKAATTFQIVIDTILHVLLQIRLCLHRRHCHIFQISAGTYSKPLSDKNSARQIRVLQESSSMSKAYYRQP